MEIQDDLPDEGHGFFQRGYAAFDSDADNDKKVVIVGDSFLVALMDYLPGDFRHTVFINWQKISETDPSLFADADILIYEFVEKYAFMIPYMTNELSRVLEQ